MLFTDSDIVTLAALAQIDSEVSAVAASTKPAIVVDGPGSICEQAWRECAARITSAMQMYTSYLAQPGMSGGHVAAVLNTGVPARTQPRTRLQQIVATDSQYGNSASAIETWMAYTALALLFRDASSRLGKDRYEEKYERYLKDADWWWKQLRNNGLPYINQPLEAPGAKHGFQSGSWSADNLSAVSQPGLSGGTFQAAVSWVDAGHGYISQASKGNAESAPSEALAIVVAADNALHVDIASLNPPTGAPDPVGLSQGAWTPLKATHWNLYVGLGSGPLYLAWELIPIATKSVTLGGDPTFTGAVMGSGQWPDLNIVFQNVVMRG
jgi:hypothetical protein